MDVFKRMAGSLRGCVTVHTLRAALRMGLGCAVPLIIDATLVKGRDINELKSCQWAAVTVLMTSEPLLGQTMKKGLERMAGSLVGGVLAMAVAYIAINQWFFCATAAVILYFSFRVLTFQWGYDYTAKLLAITYLLVLWGIENDNNILWVTSTRMLGVIGGVLLGLLLNIILTPRTGTEEVFVAAKDALSALSSISQSVWATSQLAEGWVEPAEVDSAGEPHSAPPHGHGELLEPLLSESGNGGDEVSREERMLKLIRDIDANTNKCTGSLEKMHAAIKVSQNEYLVTRHRGLLDRSQYVPVFFTWMPAFIPCWQIPPFEFVRLAQEVKCVSRILWSLHLSFSNGFDVDAMRRLQRHYPPGLFRLLLSSAQESVELLVSSCPAGPAASAPASIRRDDLHRFRSAVQQFLAVTEFQGLRAAHAIKRKIQKGNATRAAAQRAKREATQLSQRERAAAAEAVAAAALGVAGSGPLPVPTDTSSLPTPPERCIVLDLPASEQSELPLDNSGALTPATPTFSAFLEQNPAFNQDTVKDLLRQGWEPPSLAASRGSSLKVLPVGHGQAASTSFSAAEDETQQPTAVWHALSRLSSMKLQRDAEEGIFPLTDEGWLLKLRWHNLLFILEELEVNMVDCYDAMDALLEALPYRTIG